MSAPRNKYPGPIFAIFGFKGYTGLRLVTVAADYNVLLRRFCLTYPDTVVDQV